MKKNKINKKYFYSTRLFNYGKRKIRFSIAEIHLVSVNKDGKPSKVPDELKQKLEN